MKRFDVVIIGGGLVGATLALCLSKLKAPEQAALKIAVIEAFPMNTQAEGSARYTPSYDARTSAIANGTVELFESLGVWRPMREHACAIEHIHVSEVGGFGVTRIHAEEEKIPAMGYVVENHWMGAVLNAALTDAAAAAQISYFAPAQVLAWRYLDSDQGMALTVQGKDQVFELSAQLVVAADGATSSFRAMLGINSDTHDYGQSAIVTNFTTDKPHQHWAYERFTQHGPIALLPLVAERTGCVWALPPEQAEHYANCDEAEFSAALLQQIGDRIGTITRVGQRFLYPLKLTVASEQIRPHCVVLGNAAHALHPVAGQGFNLSARDARRLAQLILKKHAAHQDYSSLNALDDYVNVRETDQFNTTYFSHGLVKLFGREEKLIHFGRNLGMVLFDLWPSGKKLLARHAMGRYA